LLVFIHWMWLGKSRPVPHADTHEIDCTRRETKTNRSRAAIQLLEELGIVVDADTGEIINLQLPPPSL
jgi:hypothetical protein